MSVLLAACSSNDETGAVSGSGVGGASSSSSSSAWSTAKSAIIYWSSGADVYEVVLSSGDWQTGTWLWTNITDASNAAAPEDGVFSRFRLVRYEDAELAVVATGVNAPVYAFRLP